MKIKNKIWGELYNYALVVLGTFLMGVSFNSIFAPNNITPSGFSGLAAIISYFIYSWTGVNIPPAVFYLLVNAILYIFGLKLLGKRFAVSALVGIGSYSLFMQVCNFNFINVFSGDYLLCAIYGGLLTGIGLGLVFRGRGSTGGSDLLASILNKKYPNIKIGNMVLIIDVIVLVISVFAHGINLSLYSLIALYIMTKVTDIIVDGVKSVTAYYIITSKAKEISDAIFSRLNRGVTEVETKGMYTSTKHDMLVVIVTRAQVARLKSIVSEFDQDAFMYSTSVSEAMGKGFNPIKIKKLNVSSLSEKNKHKLNNLSLNKTNSSMIESVAQVEEKEKKL